MSYYPPMGWEFDGSSGFGDDDTPVGVQLCDVDRHGNLIHCKPYGGSSHGSEFGAGHAGGGSAPAPRTPQAPVIASVRAAGAAARAGQAAAMAHPSASPQQRAAVAASAAHAGRGGYQQHPITTQDFAMRQRDSYGHGFRARGLGYAGYGLMPRPWNDPYYYEGVGLIDDPLAPWVAEAEQEYSDGDDDFGAEHPKWLGDVEHQVSAHKPIVLGATLAAGAGYALGPLGAVAGGVGGYLLGRVLGW
jgi:hypothetical protein